MNPNSNYQPTVINMKRLFKFFTLLFFCFHLGMAQESPKKHTVSSGETIFSIAKKYNVTPYDIEKANPGVINEVKVDEVLIIPESKIKAPNLDSVAESINASVASSSISYTVKTGDTKFSLAKRFGLTIKQLESQNPEIVSGLQQGHVLEIFQPAANTSTSSSQSPTKSTVNEEKAKDVYKGETVVGTSNSDLIPTDVAKENQVYVVKSGDTKYSLAKRFNMTIATLENRNPQIKKMLIVGQTIKVPSNEPAITTEQIAPTEDKNDIQVDPPANAIPDVVETIIVTKEPIEKETEVHVTTNTPSKESAKKDKKEVTIASNKTSKKSTKETVKGKHKEEIVKNNALLETTKPESNKEVNDAVLVAKTQQETSEKPSATDISVTSDDIYIIYAIQPKETVVSLSKKANMSIDNFLALNPQLKESVQIGSLIKMPKDGMISNPISDTKVLSSPLKNASGYSDLKTSASTAQSKKLLFLLPFSQMEYENFALNGYNFSSVTDDFKRNHLEFYRGANMAIDSIRKLKLELDVKVAEVQGTNSSANMKLLAKDSNIKDYDAIILPFYETVENDLATFTSDRKIPVITASTIAYQNNANNLYSALPSINQQRRKVLDYMTAKQAHIIVLSDINREESKNFIAEHVPNADFVNLKKNGSFSESELLGKFKKDKLNFVVIDSDRNSVFLNATNVLLSEISNYTLQLAVLESSLIPDRGSVSQKRYRILNMIFPSLIPAKSTVSSKQFLSTYQKNNNLLPTANVMLGFDITFDSLLRLMQQQSFEYSVVNDITEYTQLKFDYKKNTQGGYSNEGIYILQYDSSENILEAN